MDGLLENDPLAKVRSSTEPPQKRPRLEADQSDLLSITTEKERVSWLLNYCYAYRKHGQAVAGCTVPQPQDAPVIQAWAKQLFNLDISIPENNGKPLKTLYLGAGFASRLVEKCDEHGFGDVGDGDRRFIKKWKKAEAEAVEYRKEVQPAREQLAIETRRIQEWRERRRRVKQEREDKRLRAKQAREDKKNLRAKPAVLSCALVLCINS
jgi:hypothetical protein